MVFALPKKQEQQHIASILSSLDDKIELNRKMNNTLEDMAKALFKHWFVDFEFPDEDGKPYKASGREMIESELGMIPKGWEIDTLDKIVTFNPSEGLKKGQMAKYLDMKGLSESGMWCYTDWKREYSGGSKFRNGDTLMARITPCLENGKSGFVNFLADDEIAYGSTEYVVLRSTSLDYCEYVYLLVRSENFRDIAIKSMVGSSGRQRVQMSALIEHKVVFPSTEIIAKLHRYLLPMFHKVRDNSLEIISLTLIRDSLLPKLMSGKIRVN
jgi:type I restriction enzyme S subunit